VVSWPFWYSALELNLDGSVLDAIGSMYRGDVGGAVIVDEVHGTLGKFVDRDIGFVDFQSLALWALEVSLLLAACVVFFFSIYTELQRLLVLLDI
jgi:hypothetical protein